MTRTALALSPHLDDAVFSCGSTLAMLARHGWRVVVATLFTRSMPNPQGFALACQLDKGLEASVDYMALRRTEDVEAVRRLGADPPIHLDLPEAPHRGYHSATALFGPVRPDDGIGEQLRETIIHLLQTHQPDLVLAPQAVGGHVDHVQLVEAMPAGSGSTLWWRDFPYTIRPGTPAEPFGERMDALPRFVMALDDHARAAKEDACLAYASQLGFQFGGPAGLRRLLGTAEPVEVFRGSPRRMDLEGPPFSLSYAATEAAKAH